MKKEEWLEARKFGIGGSEASAIIGCNPYFSNQDLFRLKAGRMQDDDSKNIEAKEYGRKAERPLIELFKLDYPEYDVTYSSDPENYQLAQSPDYPFIIGTVDGDLFHKERKESGILEVKTTFILQSMHKEKWKGQLPQNYYIQCLHYLLVKPHAKYVVLKAQLKTKYGDDIRLDTRHYFFSREEVKADLDFLLKKELHFWNENILKDKMPDLILPPID